MRILNLEIESGNSIKKKKHIADSVRKAIQSKLLLPCESLPSTRELAKKFSVHRHTVMTALDDLVAEGWLSSQPKKAFKVNAILPSLYFRTEIQGREIKPDCKEPHEWRFVRNPESVWPGLVSEKGKTFRFQSGLADLRLFPIDEFRKIMNSCLNDASVSDLSFGDPVGHELLRGAVKKFLRRTRQVKDREICITHGSQEAIFLASQLLLKPGDKVLVEGLGYPPAWDAFRMAGAELLGVRVDEKGIDVEHLRILLIKNRVRLIYLTPLHQYPTTVVIPRDRRREIYQLATEFGVPILEDDYDHEFHYDGQALPPMISLDSNELVVYVSTFTKVLFPSIRLGFMAVPKKLLEPLSNLKRNISRQTGFVVQDAVARWIESGGMEKHLFRMRKIYQERRDVLVGALECEKQKGLEIDFEVPKGGMALWLNTQVDSWVLQKKLAKHRVYAAPGKIYGLNSEPSQHLRLGFANQNCTELVEATRLLCAAIQEAKSGRKK